MAKFLWHFCVTEFIGVEIHDGDADAVVHFAFTEVMQVRLLLFVLQHLRPDSLRRIEMPIQRGAETLHLGRTSMENGDLRRFKLSWDSQEEMIRIFGFDMARGAWLNPRRTVIWSP